MKKILISTVAAAMVTSSLVAAGTSTIYMFDKTGSTVTSKTVHAEAVTTAGVELNATTATGASANVDSSGALFTYTPDIQMGKGNLITVTVNNGVVRQVTGNNLYLLDMGTPAATADGNYSVAARMIEKTTNSNGDYTTMTFKFDKIINSDTNLSLGNSITQASADGTDDNATMIKGKMALVTDAALACGSTTSFQVTSATDQSGAALSTALTSASASVKVIKGLSLGSCATNTCTIALPDEKSFGSTGSSTDCPSCATTTTSAVLTCDATFDFNVSAADQTYTVSTIQPTITGDFTGVSTVVNDPTAGKNAYTVSGTTATASLTATNNSTYTTRFTVDGTTKLETRTFDLAVKANSSIDVDSVSKWLKLADQGQTLKVSYMSAGADYRTFVRVTNSGTTDAEVLATITAEDGTSSGQFNTNVTVPAGGASVIEASDLYDLAVAAGYSAPNKRFNAEIYVKTSSTVDAVAYQTAGTSGSQRYLPVNGATGGKQ